MKPEDWKTYRGVWTKARDAEKVGRGAVSGVSIGDSIDSVVKAMGTGLPAVKAALAKLADRVKKYKAGIAKKSPKLHNWIEANLEKETAALDRSCDRAIHNIQEITQKVAQVCKEVGALLPNSVMMVERNKEAVAQNKPWHVLVKKELAQLTLAAKYCAVAADGVALGATATKVGVTGKEAPSVAYLRIAERFKLAHESLVRMSKCKTFAEYVELLGNPHMPQQTRLTEFRIAVENVAKNQGVG